MASKKTAVVPAAKQALVTADDNLPVELNAEALSVLASGAGLTDLSKDDIAIPFLGVLQPLSPQLDRSHSEYIEDAEAGQIFNSVTKQLYDSVTIVVSDYRRSFIEWVPRSKGGGFRGEHGLEFEPVFASKLNRETGKASLDNGNDLIDTRTFYALVQNEEGAGGEPVAISMASTQTKVAKQLVNLIQTYVPMGAPRRRYDPWAARYRLSTVGKSNDKGRWYIFNVARIGLNSDMNSAREAAAFRAQIRGGTIVVDRSADIDESDSSM
jgi:hypothetical protein